MRKKWEARARLSWRILLIAVALAFSLLLTCWEVSALVAMSLDRVPEIILDLGEYKLDL